GSCGALGVGAPRVFGRSAGVVGLAVGTEGLQALPFIPWGAEAGDLAYNLVGLALDLVAVGARRWAVPPPAGPCPRLGHAPGSAMTEARFARRGAVVEAGVTPRWRLTRSDVLVHRPYGRYYGSVPYGSHR